MTAVFHIYHQPSTIYHLLLERMKGFEPSTFCMASRRSSQLSYIRLLRREIIGKSFRSFQFYRIGNCGGVNLVAACLRRPDVNFRQKLHKLRPLPLISNVSFQRVAAGMGSSLADGDI